MNYIKQIFQDEAGNYSSKRTIGILAGLTLFATMIINSISFGADKPSPELINAITIICVSSLGLTSVDKIWAKRK
jgi:hypothetical protein